MGVRRGVEDYYLEGFGVAFRNRVVRRGSARHDACEGKTRGGGKGERRVRVVEEL